MEEQHRQVVAAQPAGLQMSVHEPEPVEPAGCLTVHLGQWRVRRVTDGNGLHPAPPVEQQGDATAKLGTQCDHCPGQIGAHCSLRVHLAPVEVAQPLEFVLLQSCCLAVNLFDADIVAVQPCVTTVRDTVDPGRRLTLLCSP